MRCSSSAKNGFSRVGLHVILNRQAASAPLDLFAKSDIILIQAYNKHTPVAILVGVNSGISTGYLSESFHAVRLIISVVIPQRRNPIIQKAARSIERREFVPLMEMMCIASSSAALPVSSQ